MLSYIWNKKHSFSQYNVYVAICKQLLLKMTLAKCLQSYFHVSTVVFPRIHNMISTYLQSYFHVFIIVFPGIYNRISPQHSSKYTHNLRFIHDDVIKWKRFCVTGPLCGEFTGNRRMPLTMARERSFDVFVDLRLNQRLSKQSRCRWFETASRLLWHHCNVVSIIAWYGHHKTVHNRTECL